jgi:hypothetical protein
MKSWITATFIFAFIAAISCSDNSTSSVPPKNKPGITWKVIDPASASALTDVTSSGSVHIAVGGNGLVLRSADSDNWDKVETPATHSLKRVEWFDTLFIAVGSGEYIMTSPDGLIWTERRSGHIMRNMCDVTRANNEFVAIGGHHAEGATVLGDVRTSTDGADWNHVDIAFEGWMNGVAWTGEQFVSVGYRSGPENYSIWTSADAIEWTLRRIEFVLSFTEDICWSGDLLVAVVGTRPGRILTSPDGMQWTGREQNNDSRLSGICWTGDQFVTVGSDGLILTSNDGITWKSRETGSTTGLRGVWGNSEMIIAVGGSQILTSHK